MRPILSGIGGATVLDQAGLPLGLFCSASYPTQRIALSPGESLILFTDGVTEAVNGNEAEFGIEGLCLAAEAHREQPAKAILDGCLERLYAFRAGGALSDDMTLMVLKRSR